MVKDKKKKSMIEKLADGDWIDKLVAGWGKPKSYNKDWNK